MLDEGHIIKALKKSFPNFIGDDAAVLPVINDEQLVITKDLLVEDVHFRRRYCSPAALAHKALHVNLSDLAAMGATPRYILLGLSIPVSYEQTWIDSFLKSFSDACIHARVVLIGGDTTASLDGLFISVTAIGSARSDHLKLRTDAKPHAIVAVAGQLGYAHIGFRALESDLDGFDSFKQAFLAPSARISEGQWFAGLPSVQAMMDTSDGIFADLTKLGQASGLGIEVELDDVQTTNDFKLACLKLGIDSTHVQFSGGEDYGLLIVVEANAYPKVSEYFTQIVGYALNKIGRTVIKKGVSFLEHGKPKRLTLSPFNHFSG